MTATPLSRAVQRSTKYQCLRPRQTMMMGKTYPIDDPRKVIILKVGPKIQVGTRRAVKQDTGSEYLVVGIPILPHI